MKRKLSLLVILVSAAVFVFAAAHVVGWFIDGVKTRTMMTEIEAKTGASGGGINFNELTKINPDTRGWIRVYGTDINYPYVQTDNNEYYLSHSFDKSQSGAGWVFMDYRSNAEKWGKNTIIYAHGRLDGTMFGSLKQALEPNWGGGEITLTTRAGVSTWRVFSVYRIPTTDDYLTVDFDNEDEFAKFAETLKRRSLYEFGVAIVKGDKILTLSTCYDDNERVVMHAKLVS